MEFNPKSVRHESRVVTLPSSGKTGDNAHARTLAARNPSTTQGRKLMIVPLIQNETVKLLRRRRFAIVLGIMLVIMTLVSYSQYRQLREQRNANWRAELQERIARPSTCSVHAPHCPMPQLNLVPVSPTWSRITHNRGVCGSASTVCNVPFTSSSNAIPSSSSQNCSLLAHDSGLDRDAPE